ncbi:MAG: energy transducer TonB [Steroidobacteraceae bacterium]
MKLRIRNATAGRASIAGVTIAVIAAMTVMTGCAMAPPPPAAPPPIVIEPVQVTTTYIAARVPRSARGEFAIVEVCVAADGAVADLRIAQSSADQAFDRAAIDWARQVRYQPQLENGRPVYGCEHVRVEVNPNPTPRIGRGADSALG